MIKIISGLFSFSKRKSESQIEIQIQISLQNKLKQSWTPAQHSPMLFISASPDGAKITLKLLLNHGSLWGLQDNWINLALMTILDKTS